MYLSLRLDPQLMDLLSCAVKYLNCISGDFSQKYTTLALSKSPFYISSMMIVTYTYIPKCNLYLLHMYYGKTTFVEWYLVCTRILVRMNGKTASPNIFSRHRNNTTLNEFQCPSKQRRNCANN